MFKDILPIFKEIYEREGRYRDKDELITDDYILKTGEYILIGDNNIQKMIISGNKKKLEEEQIDPLYNKFCKLDYNSSLLTMNKSIDKTKQIHSNNFYSFFFKIENKDKLTKEVIDGYYKILKNPYLKYTKPLQKQMYKSVEEKLGTVDIEKLEKLESYIKENIDTIINECSIGKGYVKIFFDEPISEYEREGNRYFLSNIYNVVDYNTLIDEELYGIPGFNLGCNSDKPNLKHRGSAPFLLSLEDALMQKKLADFLSNQAANQKYNVYIGEHIDEGKYDIKAYSNKEEVASSFTGVYLRVQKIKELEIIDYSIISNFNPILKSFDIKDYIVRDMGKYQFTQQKVRKLKDLETIIDKNFFNSFLVNSYFSDPKKLNNPKIKQALISNREALFDWFYKGDSTRVKGSYEKFTIDLIYNSIENSNEIAAIERFNLRMSLKKYFGGSIVNLYELKEELLNRLDKTTEFSFFNDDEYCMGVGQLAAYLTQQSQASEKTFSLGMPVLKAKNRNIVNTELKRLFEKYGYRISQSNKRFNNLFVAILDYRPKTINSELILAGYMMNNIMFNKKEVTTKEEL